MEPIKFQRRAKMINDSAGAWLSPARKPNALKILAKPIII